MSSVLVCLASGAMKELVSPRSVIGTWIEEKDFSFLNKYYFVDVVYAEHLESALVILNENIRRVDVAVVYSVFLEESN